MRDQTLAGAIDKAAREALAQLTRVQREQVLAVLEYVRDHTVTPRKALELIDERILTGAFLSPDLPELEKGHWTVLCPSCGCGQRAGEAVDATPEPAPCPPLPRTCTWKQVDLDEWSTQCGRKYRRCPQCLPHDPGFEDLGVTYCPHCGALATR